MVINFWLWLVKFNFKKRIFGKQPAAIVTKWLSTNNVKNIVEKYKC